MATSNEPTPMHMRVKQVYTFNEAIELMKMFDKYPTTGAPLQWRSVKTGKPVYIGYNG